MEYTLSQKKRKRKNRMYEVLNDNNVFKQISDEDIEIAVKENNVTYMVMQAMGQSHREEYSWNRKNR